MCDASGAPQAAEALLFFFIVFSEFVLPNSVF